MGRATAAGSTPSPELTAVLVGALLSGCDPTAEGSLANGPASTAEGIGGKCPAIAGLFAALGGLGLLIDGGLGDIGQRFVRRLLFLKGLLQK